MGDLTQIAATYLGRKIDHNIVLIVKVTRLCEYFSNRIVWRFQNVCTYIDRIWSPCQSSCATHNVQVADEQADERNRGHEEVASDGVVVGAAALGEEVEAGQKFVLRQCLWSML
jgi:hypothetical protein